MEFGFWETVRSSPTFIILFGCSVIAATFILERLLYFRRTRIDTRAFFVAVSKHLQAGDMNAGIQDCENFSAPLAAVTKVAFENHSRGDKRLMELMDAAALEEKMKMERFVSILGTMGNIAPFIGLFGTVVGIIRAFNDLAVSGSGGPSVVAAGIAEALITTAAGLVVAIPAVVFYNYFLRRIGNLLVEIEATTKKIRVVMAHTKPNVRPSNARPEVAVAAKPRHAERLSQVAAI